jgi:BirA family biotin operon repressor/biotin-[acetyl-CoA-carboxylase] ligase
MTTPSPLNLLIQHAPDWVSSEILRQPAGISRAAISKQIRKLTALGYEIESSPRKGYRLVREPDKPAAAVMEPLLKGTRFAAGIHRFEEVTGSTNDDIRSLAREAAPEGSWVCAEVQENGRGRLGRSWHNRAGDSLLCSLLLRPPLSPLEATLIPLAAAAAIQRALVEAGLDAVGIKWPNDVLIDGRKVCGILCEMSVDMDRIEHAVLGFGLNVHTPASGFPPELRETACSLAMRGGGPWNRPRILAAILHRLDALLDAVYAGRPDTVLEVWRQGAVTLGRSVKVTFANGQTLEGVAEDVDPRGALLLRLPDGNLRSLHSGEVTLGTLHRS